MSADSELHFFFFFSRQEMGKTNYGKYLKKLAVTIAKCLLTPEILSGLISILKAEM